MENDLKLVVLKFLDVSPNLLQFEKIGKGHINTTYKVIFEDKAYILQSLNLDIFDEKILEDCEFITSFFRKNKIPSFCLMKTLEW